MRIGIDLACWANRRGYGRYTRCLVSALLAADHDHRFVLFVDAVTAARHTLPAGAEIVTVETRQAAADATRGRRSLADLWAFRRAVAGTRLDVFWVPSVFSYVPLRTRAAVVLGVHDTIAEDYPTLVFPRRSNRWLWTLKNRLAHRRADYVLAVSDYAQRSIRRHFRHPPERVWSVVEAPDPVFQPLAPERLDDGLLRRLGLAPSDRFLLYVGGVNPHKNLLRLVDALAALRADHGNHGNHAHHGLRLLVVGDLDDGFTPGYAALRAHIAARGLSSAVVFTGFLDDPDVVQLMNRARALVLPSQAEGFGLPAVEAAACGTPVVATRNSPLPALLAGGGHFIDPTSTASLISGIEAVIGNESRRQDLGREALRRARALDWDRSAGQLLALFETIAPSAKPIAGRP